jgi:hypothetical protein
MWSDVFLDKKKFDTVGAKKFIGRIIQPIRYALLYNTSTCLILYADRCVRRHPTFPPPCTKCGVHINHHILHWSIFRQFRRSSIRSISNVHQRFPFPLGICGNGHAFPDDQHGYHRICRRNLQETLEPRLCLEFLSLSLSLQESHLQFYT